jgi:pyruvate carboxylase
MSAKLNMFKDSPVALSKYMSDNPLAEVSVEIYNHEVGKDLNKLREEAKAVRLLNVPPNVRENMLKVNRLQQNIIKHDLVQTFKAFNIKP